MRITALAGLAVAAAQNSSATYEAVDPVFGDDLEAVASLAQLSPTLEARDSEATELPQSGIAALIGPNETHVYELNMSEIGLNYTLSLSECSRTPLSADPLRLTSGHFSGSTAKGGVLQVHNLTSINSTLVVSAPIAEDPDTHWSYQLGYDRSAMYSSSAQGLYWVDSDFANSLFVTESYRNFSQLLLNTPYEDFVNFTDLNATTEKFSMFLHPVQSNKESTPSNSERSPLSITNVLGNSYCAMEQSALLNQNNAVFSTTTRGNTNGTQKETIYKGQFLFSGLNLSSDYTMQLGIAPPDGYVGGFMLPTVAFHTKKSMSCQLIYNMTMCPSTAFSVPGNASAFSADELTELYDEYVARYYNNFTQALAQVNCHSSKENAFSVFSTCKDCEDAYRDWLCTVAVPRCQDWSSNASYLMPRERGQSRNNMIESIIRPDHYKEVLPCYWLCNNLVKNCPVSMGFMCPSGKFLNLSYGHNADDGDVTCSYPGAVYTIDRAWLAVPSLPLVMLGVLLVTIL